MIVKDFVEIGVTVSRNGDSYRCKWYYLYVGV